MNQNQFSHSPHLRFEVHQINSTGKTRDSPTSSILKTPTPIFVTTRNSKTRRLKFANGPIDLQTLKNGTHESNVSVDFSVDTTEERKLNNGEISVEESIVEVAISPVKTMQVSPESWKAFLEYKKFNDYPNETEKTDYTYSRLSKFRHKEIIPGFLIRPNLSRASIYSRRSSSVSLPSNQSSFNESYLSENYDFKVHNQSGPDILNDIKLSSQPNQFVRSRYYLRSSNPDWKDVRVSDFSNQNYFEKDNYVHSPEEKFVKKFAYTTTTESPEPTPTPYYSKLNSTMDFDNAEVDEVDINPIYGEKHYYTRSGSKVGPLEIREAHSQTVSQYFKNFFTTVFLYITSVGTLSRNLFSKYILRKQSDWDRSPSAHFGWEGHGFGRSTASTSWMNMGGNTGYSIGSYSRGHYGQSLSWYQRIYYYFYDKFSQFTNLFWGSDVGYGSYRRDTSRKISFWWFFIPFLLLAGSFLAYVDFFSNPKTILNTMYNWVLFILSFLHYTVMTFIPWLIFEAVPHVILKTIPNFVMVTLPYFILNTVPHYFWVVVHFFATLSLTSIWNFITGVFSFVLNFLLNAAAAFYNILSTLIWSAYFVLCMFSLFTGFWLYRAEQESGFLSDQYKALDCKTNGFLTSLESAVKPVWRSGYIAYKRAAASASCYVNDSLERLKLPFVHVKERFSSFSEGSFGFLFSLWTVLWQGLWNVFALIRDTFSNSSLFLLSFITDFMRAVNSMLYYTTSYILDIFFTFCNSLGWVFGNAWKLLANTLSDIWSYLYLLFLVPRSEVKYEYGKQAMSNVDASSGEICLRQQKSIDKLTSDFENLKSFTWDLSSVKKKIDELEAEFRKEKEFRKNQNDFFDKQLDNNHKTLQKYQAAINRALLTSKRPGQVSSSSIQYLLDNQSDSIKQWITENFLLKSDSAGLDENKIALLVAKYGNRTGEELQALKQELEIFAKNHKNDFESLRSNFNTLGANNLDGSDISLAFVRKLINDAIKLYDADKTGRVDYALETAGGHVQSIRCTETYTERPKSYIFWGWPIFTETSSPSDAIRPVMAVGQCWSFVGSQGFLVLQLSHTIKVTGFTMEHISKMLVPQNHIKSAPKNFSMWGLKYEQDLEPYLFGEYTYLDNDETLQYFPVTYPTNQRYSMVELKITSNHGNPNYTCLYRIRVHGDLEPVHL